MRQVTVNAMGRSPTSGWATSETNFIEAGMFADRVQAANIPSYFLPSIVLARMLPIVRGSGCFPPRKINAIAHDQEIVGAPPPVLARILGQRRALLSNSKTNWHRLWPIMCRIGHR